MALRADPPKLSSGGKGGEKSGSNKGLAITLPLLFILILAASAIGGWFWWSRRRVAATKVSVTSLTIGKHHYCGPVDCAEFRRSRSSVTATQVGQIALAGAT